MGIINLTPLFQMQKVLRDRIGYTKPDRLGNLVLAFLVEVGECANEWRGFKFWSKDQKPRTTKISVYCSGKGEGYFSGSRWTGSKEVCIYCSGCGENNTENPLLEEYVDGLHFVLELAIEMVELEALPNVPSLHRTSVKEKTILQQFKTVMRLATSLELAYTLERPLVEHTFKNLLDHYIGLGNMLGFTWEQIEQAYMDKNAVNHQRQEQGY